MVNSQETSINTMAKNSMKYNNSTKSLATNSSGSSSAIDLSRCPLRTNKPGVYMYNDVKLCNVYHECNCTDNNSSYCTLVKTNVCPIGLVFLNTTNKCEPIELYGCDSSYLQSIQLPKSSENNGSIENDYSNLGQRNQHNIEMFQIAAESTNITGLFFYLYYIGKVHI